MVRKLGGVMMLLWWIGIVLLLLAGLDVGLTVFSDFSILEMLSFGSEGFATFLNAFTGIFTLIIFYMIFVTKLTER